MRKSSPNPALPVGVLLFASAGSRIVGDPGMPGTFDFPVEYGVVPGSYRDLLQGSDRARDQLCQAARALEQRGVCAIAGDCGLMALYQRELACSVRVPVVSSSLVLLPLLRTMLGGERKIGLLTGHSQLLTSRHLEAAGIGGDANLMIQGMEEEPHFRDVVLEGRRPQDYALMAQDVLHAVGRMVAREPGLGALVLECSNLTTFAWEVEEHYHIPVFDVNLAIRALRLGRDHIRYG